MDKIIFNTSMPRAGSELLQVILSQNPSIYASPTSPLLEYQFGSRSNFNLPEVRSQNAAVMKEAFNSMCLAMAHGYYSAITDKPIVVDKNRGWSHYYEWVSEWCPNPKMICMVRDIRSILASLERIYRNNRHNPETIDNPAKLENMTVFERCSYWLSTQPVGLAAKRTLDIFQKDLQDKVLFIRYEDLLSSPQEVMNKLYAYIEEPVFNHDFNNLVKNVEEDDSFYGIFGQHSVAKELKPLKPSDWSDVLNKDIANAVKDSMKWYSDVFQY